MRYLSDYMDEAQSDLFEVTGSFFAFGQKQFDEQKIDGVKYVSLGAGLICPKGHAKKVIEEIDRIYDDAIQQDIADHGAEKIVEREYFNHETQISNRYGMLQAIEGHREARPDLFTDGMIDRVCKKCFAKAVENEWF